MVSELEVVVNFLLCTENYWIYESASEKALRDYTHYVKARSGYQEDIDTDLIKESGVRKLPE